MTPAPKTRVLFLEIDAGDRELIREWARDGTMPVVGRLLRDGLSGDTMSSPDFFVGGIWPSLYTGVSPARHGIHSLVQLRVGTYDFYRCYTGDEIRRRPFWEKLSDAGRRVAILDVPLSGLSDDLNGIQTVEWGSHDANYGFRAQPQALENEILERYGPHPLVGPCNLHGSTPGDYVGLRDTLLEGVRRKGALTRHYLGRGDWDFFAQVFTESHCAGHQCWHLHDPTHPAHDPEVAAVTGDPMRAVYRAIDDEIGRILSLVDERTTVVLVAGHRMAHKFGAQFLLPDILVRLGVAVAKKSRPPDLVDRVDAALTWGWQHTPASIRRPLQGLRRALRSRIDERHATASLPPSVSRLDAAASRCFLMDNGFPVSGLRLNLVGREPAGLIHPGADADAFCAQLRDDLLALRDASTGIRMVRDVRFTDDHYAGEYRDRLPDVLVAWNDEHRLGNDRCGNAAGSLVRVCSDKLGDVEGVNHYIRTGDHRPEGMFVCTGPGIGTGRVGPTVSIMDFAPTFCELLGVSLQNVDGVVIPGIVPPRRSTG